MKEQAVKIRPLGDHIVVRRAPSETKVGTIVLPDSAQQKPQRGEVLAVGPGKFCPEKLVAAFWCRASSAVEVPAGAGYAPMHVKVGDVVLFSQWAGSEIKELGDDVVVMSESDVLGIVEK